MSNDGNSDNYFDLIIIGGGASGLVAAIAAARFLGSQGRVLILEKEKRAGRKLLATGNGRCNLSNINADPDIYLGEEARFARGPLHRFSSAATLSFFEELGLIVRQDQQGRVYPACNQAAAVLDVLRLEIHRLGVEIKTDTKVKDISKTEPLYLGRRPISGAPAFIVSTALVDYQAAAVILATGGMAAPALGADGSGYRLAGELGHHLIKPFPSLVPLCIQTPVSKKCSGIRFEADAAVMKDNQILQKASGEFLWTEYGLSGIAAMELARTARLNSYEEKNLPELEIDFLPALDEQQLENWLISRISQHQDLVVDSVLTGLLHRRLGEEIVRAGVKNLVLTTLAVSRLTAEHISGLVKTIKHFRARIIGTRDWDQAQVTAGGLDVRDFYPDRLESRLCEGLFAAGEVLDIDAPCGGYNLQWAWSSGWQAGYKAAAKLLNREN